ncbi:uncharacterized protein yc1106_05992 [Curvularia clavata]|uniref:Uncharacterized protein n=1 Tax=Curvularia clavata TaxID=95742 RepID=A0A9Q8ZDH2_CURCL|nr:uncharacterized protein yc1106_05992 [Curvularia clavata]
MDSIRPIEQLIRNLKVDRDTWQAVALQFKAAFEAQTARLQELQGICFATQAELENERAQNHRVHSTTVLTESHSDGLEHCFGIATIYSPPRTDAACSRRPFYGCTNPLFDRARECVDQKNYGSALAHVERLLHGPLSSRARAEGLLLKSVILQASGPEDVLDALAACSEAVELCNRHSELDGFLPQIRNQRNSLYQELQVLHKGRDAFGTPNSHDHMLPPKASEFYNSESDEPGCAKRRSGFDESRTMEGLLAQLEEKSKDVRAILLVLATCELVLTMSRTNAVVQARNSSNAL